jgi:hypothetical protein
MSDQVPSQFGPRQINGNKLINVGGGAGITSLNGDTTAAQILNPGAGITITPGPAGTLTISTTAAAALLSINGDTTQAQLITAGLGLSVTDNGVGGHALAIVSPAIVQVNDPGTSIPDSVFTAICSSVLAFSPTPGIFELIGQVTFPGTGQSGSVALQLFDVTNAVLLAENSASLASNGTTNETLQVSHIVSFAASPTTVELRVFYQNSGGLGATCVAGGATRLIRKRIF